MNLARNWTPRSKIIVGFAIVMASAGVLAFASLYVLYRIDILARGLSDFSQDQRGQPSHHGGSGLRNRAGGWCGRDVGSLASLWFVVTTLGSLLRGLAQSLVEESSQINRAASQVSSASQALAQGASQQAASLEETSASLEEMSSMTQRNAESIGQVKEHANAALAAANAGSTDMQTCPLPCRKSSDE